MSKKYVVVLIALVFCLVHTGKGSIEGSKPNVIKDVKNDTKSERTGRAAPLHKECSGSFSAKCMKIHFLSFLEDLNSRDELPLLIPGLSIVKENDTKSSSTEELAAELSRQFPGKPDEKLNRFILYRLQDYLDGHSLRYKLLDLQTTKKAMDAADGQDGADGQSEARRRRRGGGGGALIAAAVMMKGALAAAALGALALLAGKALMTALISLLLSAIVGLKGGGGHKSTTYEIITKPEVSHHHSHSLEEHHDHGHHGGYKRAYDTAYNSYVPYDTTSTNVK